MSDIDRKMLEALICPQTGAPLKYDAERQELNPTRRIWPTRYVMVFLSCW